VAIHPRAAGDFALKARSLFKISASSSPLRKLGVVLARELKPNFEVGRLKAFKKARKCWVSAPAFDIVVLNDVDVRRALS
jgi:hypothetical protein